MDASGELSRWRQHRVVRARGWVLAGNSKLQYGDNGQANRPLGLCMSGFEKMDEDMFLPVVRRPDGLKHRSGSLPGQRVRSSAAESRCYVCRKRELPLHAVSG